MSARTYSSPLRKARAEATRERILDAARRLLGKRGLHGASLKAIAAAAKVSEPTVYAVFGSKERLAQELYLQLKREIRLGERYQALMGAADPRQKLALAASITRDYSERGIAVIEALKQAGPLQRSLQAGWRAAEAMRHEGQLAMVRTLPLKPGLSAEDAADVVWSLTGHELYVSLVTHRGWRPERYERWLAATLAQVVLAVA